MAEDNGTNHSIELTESIGVDGSIEVNLRSYFSHNHILSAAYLAREAGKLEAEHTDDLPDQAAERDEVWTTHQSHVITSLISSVSFLESTVLELFTDICDDGQRVEELDPEFCRKVQVLDAYADDFLNGLSTIEKFQLALDLDGSQRFDTGAQPYQDAYLLKQLRNYLLHHEPDSVQAHPQLENPPTSVARGLQTKGFDRNPLMTGPFFPNQCLSHGCAAWGVTTSLEFADVFFDRLDMDPPYEHLRSRLATAPE